jgi:hypothetical protein
MDTLGNAPCWGGFDFKYKGVVIRVPAFLNNVARYKPDTFWNWLISKYSNTQYIGLNWEDVKEEELGTRRYP